MKIIDILSERPTLSFEFFPPKTDAGIDSLFRAIGRLKTHAPDYVSVTYGAGGSTKALTEELAVRIKDEQDLLVMAHVTCSAQSRDEIHQVLARYEAGGIENVIALRGDPASGGGCVLGSGGWVRPCDGPAEAHQGQLQVRAGGGVLPGGPFGGPGPEDGHRIRESRRWTRGRSS